MRVNFIPVYNKTPGQVASGGWGAGDLVALKSISQGMWEQTGQRRFLPSPSAYFTIESMSARISRQFPSSIR